MRLLRPLIQHLLSDGMIVQVKGTCSLSKSIVERLLYLEAKVSTPLRDTLSKQHSSLIQHTRAELMEVDGDYVISLDNSPADLVVGKDLVIHDMISDGCQNKWSSKVFHDWIDGNTLLTGGTHWWVGQSDVADAIARIGLNAQKVEDMHICGRRAWGIKETYDEFTHLWSRSKSGKSGQFTFELLEPKFPPGVRVEPIVASTNKRPNISDLHEALLKVDGQGWRPAQNLRVALMHFLAGVMS